MNHYPESIYRFDPYSVHHDGTVTVYCTVMIGDMSRTMWLPVMDNRNNAIKNPDSRKISDTKMRCLVKCIAMFGLGLYIYAGEDLPQGESLEDIKRQIMEKYSEPVLEIKAALAKDDIFAASSVWFGALNDDHKKELWVAPSKGGVFTTEERNIMKSKEFRDAYFGEKDE